MSSPKHTARRLSLLAGSSLVAASLTAAVSLGVVLAPTAAVAQTCTPGTAPGANSGADTYTCSGTPFSAGITYSSAGNLTVNATTSGMDIGSTGISLIGNGSDTVTFGSRVEIDGVGLTGALLDIETASGDITVNAASLDADQTSATAMTHGLLATSGSGNITMVITGTVDAEASGGNLAGQAGIQASTGGAGSVDISSSGVQGRLYGIRAAATGSGAVTIAASSAASAHFTAGVAGIHATAGTGTVTITGSAFGGAGTGVYIDAGGDVAFTGGATGDQYGVYLEDVAAGTTSTLNLTGEVTGGVAAIFAQGDGEVAVNVVRSISDMNFDFTGMADTVDVTILEGALWRVEAPASSVPNGNFNITIAEGGGLVAGNPTDGFEAVVEPATVITFADPDSVLVNNGVIVVGPDTPTGISTTVKDEHEAELRFVGLGEFRHSGLIVMGNQNVSGDATVPGSTIDGVSYGETDFWADDILSMPGTHWVGEGGTIMLDVNLGRSQADCARDPANGDLAADCLLLVGGQTEGVTYLTILDRLAGDRGRLTDGILLVDVTGGTSAQGHFVIGPDTPGYSPLFGGSLDKGLYQYVVVYDEDREQHILQGMVSGGGHQFAMLATAAQSLWRTSTGTWLDRQADLRGDIQQGIGGGVWLRASAEQADRDVTSISSAGGVDFAFDNAQSQKTYAVTGGVDLMSEMDGHNAYVVGLMAGYAHADLEYDASPNEQAMDGWTAGAYASFITRGLYVDAAINANNIILDNDTPAFNFFPEGTIVSSRLTSVGARVEAGWRLPFDGGLFLEPLAGLSYVKSSYDDVMVRPDDPNRLGLEVSYDDPTSLRAGVGGRVGLDQDFGMVRAQFSLLGRVWNEFEGENAIAIHNPAYPNDADAIVADDFSGQFTELGVGASVYSPGGVVSGFVNLGGKFGDDYEARTGSLGVRVAW